MLTRLSAPKFLLIAFALISIVFLSACSGDPSYSQFAITPEGAKPVDPLFREFYDLLGGQNFLGPAISPLFRYGDHKYQYVQAGVMEYNPNATPSERFRMSPLGLDMGIYEPPVPQPEQSDQAYIDGHVIYNGFVSTYRKLGGARFVGRPLTEVHYNANLKRYEQYFENLGFYWMESDAPEVIYLLAYGSWKCADACKYLDMSDAVVDLPKSPPSVDNQFREVVSRLGSSFTGFVLSDPYQATDGQVEQIYENIVLVADVANPSRVSFRSLPGSLGILPEPLVAANNVQGMVFWPLDGDLGHNVPQVFYDYITLHGGIEVSGPPIGELGMAGDRLFRQCFANYCLDYHMRDNVAESMRIRPAPLGQHYRDLFYKAHQNTNFIETQSLGAISLQVWERYPLISSEQNQEIGASIFEGSSPLKSIEPILYLTMPDGDQKASYFPPTGDDGQTFVILEPIPAKNGTLIPYQVCISSLTNEIFCVRDSFLIWFNP
ncbi:MAG: hypothetical protein EHM70_00910 [Chloroflexota bacterium]|nr:MAG: hypothetical protein EHM70_00910 [Chloroflexota bacterium]